jgi:GWxTD domain-containing protein
VIHSVVHSVGAVAGAFVSCLVIGVTPAAAQRAAAPAVPTDVLVRDALARAGTGDTAAALDLLHQATEQAPRDPDALYWRGLMLSRTTDLGLADTPRRLLAWHLLSRGAKIDGRNPRFYLEMGRIRLKTPLLRVEADRFFRRALDVARRNNDPLQLAEITWELGQIRERRYLSGRDRWLYTDFITFDPILAQNQLHYVRNFLDQRARPVPNSGASERSQAEEYYRQGVRAAPTHEPSVVSLMGLLYDQQRYDEMRDLAQPLLRDRLGSHRVWLAAGLAELRRGRPADAQRAFDEALLRMTPAERDELLDLGRIVREGDALRLAGLSERDRARTDSAFWAAADPILATPENEARLEYLARLAYADLRFTDAEMKQVGWRTDRGLIIARYGEPPVVATFSPNADLDQRDAAGRVITVWFYPRTEMQFVFTGPPAMNYATFAGNFRDYTKQLRATGPFLLDNLPIALGVDTIPLQVARFRGATAREADVLVAATIDANGFYRDAEIDQGALDVTLRLGPPSQMRVVDDTAIAVAVPSRGRIRYRWEQRIRSGDYRLRLEAHDPSVRAAFGRAQVELALLPYHDDRLESSDILIADRHAHDGAPIRARRDLGLSPRGETALAPLDTVSIYWENYGLVPDSTGDVRFNVHLTVTLVEIDRSNRQGLVRFLGGVGDAVGLTAEGNERLGLRFDRTEPLAARDRVPTLVTFGMGSAPAGRYLLELEITDRVSGRTTRTQRPFSIRPTAGTP